LGNREARDILVRDPNKMVALAAVRSPKIQEAEIDAISKSKHVCEEVLRQIASTKEWSKLYHIKFNLASNSKTPIPLVMQFLPHLREPDLRKLAKSKNISQVVATQARRIAESKSGDKWPADVPHVWGLRLNIPALRRENQEHFPIITPKNLTMC